MPSKSKKPSGSAKKKARAAKAAAAEASAAEPHGCAEGSPARPSVAGPSVAGASSARSSVAGPSVAGPSVAGPSIAGPSGAGASAPSAAQSRAAPSAAAATAQPAARPVAGPSAGRLSRPGESARSGDLSFVEQPSAGVCVGTLRWSEDSAFPQLPPWPKGVAPPPLAGWRSYLENRLEPDESGSLRVEPPQLDGLSYPLSLLRAMQLLRLQPPSPGPLTILVIGASSRAEERLQRDSNYWEELGHFLPSTRLKVVFVGPEIDRARDGKTSKVGLLEFRAFRGTLGELLRREPRHSHENAIVAGFNTGMGSGLWPLMKSWLPDLIALLRGGFVAVFTCANDFSDLRGEQLVFKMLGARTVLAPHANPFKAASIVHEPGEPGAKQLEWSCSSSFVYAVQGREEDAEPLPPSDDAALLSALRKLAKRHRETQVPSPMP